MPNLNQCDGQRLHRAPDQETPHRRFAFPIASAALLLLTASLTPKMLPAQAASAPAAAPGQKPVAHTSNAHPHSTVHHSVQKQAKKPAAGTVAPPPPPPRPNWPAEQPPTPAKVTWDSKGLAIEASNSSLQQILNEVSADTGVKLQGLNQDERVFGNYGPAPAREILSQLLDGAGYNVLMIGGSGDEPPRQIILTPSTPGTPEPAGTNNNNSADEEPDSAQTYPEPRPSPMGPGGPPRTPQQIQQEMLMRQQQMQQQQIQQQQIQQQQMQQQRQQQQQPGNPRF